MTKKWIILVLAGLCFCIVNQLSASEHSSLSNAIETNKLEDFPILNEKEGSLLDAILVVERVVRPDIDIPKYKREITNLAIELYHKLDYYHKFDDPVDYMKTFLHNKGFRQSDTSSFIFSDFLETKHGNSLLFSLLYLAIAEKLYFSLYAIDLPDHMIIRYQDKKNTINIEPSIEKGNQTDHNYIVKYDIADSEIQDGLYLRNLSRKEIIAHLLSSYSSYFYIKREFEKSLGAISKAIELHPRNPKLYYHRAEIYAELQKYDKAVADIKHLTDLDPSHSYAYYLAANISIRQEDFDKASEYVEQVDVNDNANTLLMQGIYYENIGDYDKALKLMKKALLYDFNNANSYHHIAMLYSRKKDYDAALKNIDTAISLLPTYHTFHYEKALYHLYKQSLEPALESIQNALSLQPDHPDYLLLQTEITNALNGNWEANTLVVATESDNDA